MKLKNVAIGALLATSALAAGDDEDVFDELVGSSQDDKSAAAAAAKAEEPAKSSGIEHPQWTPFNGVKDAFFFEQFGEGAEQRWKPSNAKKDEEFSYVGKWGFEEATVLPGFKGDRGLVVKSPAAHHAITHKFASPLDNTDKTLVVQYEVKLQKGLECGGAYMKLLSENTALHAEEFNNDTPYQIMFGPDKCGATNKVHFIIRRKNPKTGEYEEKHLGMPPTARLNKLTNLYTLVINADQTFDVRLNGEVIRAGNLLIDGLFRPHFNPPEQIQDGSDFKPADWVDDEQIPDPEQATKPEDWDEDAPFNIADPDDVKPADWLDDEPTEIVDPEAEKPEDWDDEEDGEFVAPLIQNPKCVAASGCGEWVPSLIRNPDYKGKWAQPQIPNPDYKGPWTPRLIPNPDYFEDTHPSNLEPIGGIGFELWTMQEDILFNNIYVGHSVAEAEAIGNATFVPKLEIEKKEEEALAPPPTKKERKNYDSGLEYFQDDPTGFLTDVARSFIIGFSLDPKQAIIDQPLAAVAFGSIFLTVSALGFGLLSVLFYFVKSAFSSPSTPATGKKADKVVEDKSDDKAKTSSSAAGGATTATKRKA